MIRALKFCVLMALVAAMAGGCARTARDTTGFALENTATVDAPFEETWHAIKTVLRERDLDIYTRDKRGNFVAFSNSNRQWLQPTRVKYTIRMEPVTEQQTQIKIETLRQVYGVTLLTYPGWHDRAAKSNDEALAILDGVQAKVSGVGNELAVEEGAAV